MRWKKLPGQAWLRFGVLVLCALALEGVPLLYGLLPGDAGTALYFLHLYGALPLCALLIPLWAGMGGTHPMAACFPIGLLELLLPVYQSPGVGFACLLLSLLGAAAGNEIQNRRAWKGKSKHHGGKKRP